MSVIAQIDELIDEAKRHGIPRNRLYVGEVKAREMKKEIADYQWSWGGEGHIISGAAYKGMKVVFSSKPGMSIGL